MWKRLGKIVIRYRALVLLLLLACTAVMGYFASKVKLSYEFAKAIPTDNPRYRDYQAFKKQFGDDGNMLVVGVQDENFFRLDHFTAYKKMEEELRQIHGVESIISVPSAITLKKDSLTERLQSIKIFAGAITQQQVDSARAIFYNLPFYRSSLYNPATNAYLLGVRVNKEVLSSKGRSEVIGNIVKAAEKFESVSGQEVHLSGLPLIRTQVADRIQAEMKIFLAGSVLLSIVILLMFFRSLSTTFLSLSVVLIGVVWTVGIIHLCGYQITLLTALMPSLVVVIGIPNCIYFINKYHTAFIASGDKIGSLVNMVGKMGIVTLFCNITAAIGFAVFALTESAILKEFGVVAGLSIMVIFLISFTLLPAALSLLPAPGAGQLRYLKSRWITTFLDRVETWAFGHKKWVLGITVLILVAALAGMARLKTVGYIVDDLPRSDKIYTDLKFFEQHFKGVMPLEVVVDTKRKNGLTGLKALAVFEKVDSLALFMASRPEMAKPLSLAEGLKFAKQAFYEMDSTQYLLPNTFDGAFVGEYLKPSADTSTGGTMNNILRSFMDSNRQITRLSVSMKDIGTEALPLLLDTIRRKTDQLFDTSKYKVTLTGTSITFLEGSRFIISGLKESVFWAFLLISLCMLYLFRSVRIVLCSLIPNIIPLLVTAGVMGWVGLPLKPSTVLVFSVALGIAVDITIRFLVNYKQELPELGNDPVLTVKSSIRHTGLSIVYTSMVLTAGFVIFCASTFGGTVSLGWLTSLTLVTATLTNLLLLPVLLLLFSPVKKKL